MPIPLIDQGACSRLEPQPKLSPATCRTHDAAVSQLCSCSFTMKCGWRVWLCSRLCARVCVNAIASTRIEASLYSGRFKTKSSMSIATDGPEQAQDHITTSPQDRNIIT